MKTYNERIDSINSKVKAKRKQRAAIITASSVACVLLVLTVVCSLPILGGDVPSINAYKNDEYYPIIQKINAQYASDKHSIFEQLGNAVGNMPTDDNASRPTSPDTDAPTSPSPDVSEGSNGNNNKYEDNTLNQVDGVIEGDLLKRS